MVKHSRILGLGVSLLVLLVLLAGLRFAPVQAQATGSNPIAPQIFLRGLQLEGDGGVRYTATVIKPTDSAMVRNLSMEITLPADAVLRKMLLNKSISFNVLRRNRAGQLTLIWQVAQVAPDQPLPTFSFLLEQPVTSEVELFSTWQIEQNAAQVENFAEIPPLFSQVRRAGEVIGTGTGFAVVADTGVSIAAPLGVELTVRVLPLDFNPPASLGAIWWCSLVELTGKIEQPVSVLAPLRQPLAPYTALQLFQQQADGSWLPLAEQAIVTADGQMVLYTHPGGVVATGGPPEIQPVELDAATIPIQPAPENNPPSGNDQPAPLPSDAPAEPPVNVPTQITDGSSNTIIIAESTLAPANTIAPVTDGSSNTVIITERTAPAPTNAGNPKGNATFVANGPTITLANTIAPITDGSSNTIIITERTATFAPTNAGNPKGNATFVANVPTITLANTIAPITDGSSNTIIITERTATFAPTNVGNPKGNATFVANVPTLAPANTIAPITDGSSNTIIITERTATPTVAVRSTSVPTNAPTSAATRVPTIAPPNPVNPVVTPVRLQPFGAGGTRVEIIVTNGVQISQCSSGGINCAPLNRRFGTRLR